MEQSGREAVIPSADALTCARYAQDLADRVSRPVATRREPGAGPPEQDRMWVEISFADMARAAALAGHMDGDYLRSMPPHARPSEEFCQEMDLIFQAAESVRSSIRLSEPSAT